ncbi:hypothetical protein [Paremcibacter congregatus]|uniref:hypothetical protein n=1 Tax=Paremcibacter congregatus TaxID=2043170 RepID=UPI003A8FC4EF
MMEAETDVVNIKMDHGQATVCFGNHCISIDYRMFLSGRLYSHRRVFDTVMMGYYIPGPMKFFKQAFYGHSSPLPELASEPENVLAVRDFENFIDVHGQTVLDEAAKRGMVEE